MSKIGLTILNKDRNIETAHFKSLCMQFIDNSISYCKLLSIDENGWLLMRVFLIEISLTSLALPIMSVRQKDTVWHGR